MMKRKAQGLSITTIVVAALALIVLVVVAFIFSSRIGRVGEGLESCSNQGGKCIGGYTTGCISTGACECPDPDREVIIRGTDCEANSQFCCKKVY